MSNPFGHARRAAVCFLTTVVASSSVGAAAPDQLLIGDRPPPLGDKATWIRGSPVDQFELGRVYVLDYWATWCGPCIANIPHLNELSSKYKDQNTTIIGIAVQPSEASMSPRDYALQEKSHFGYAVAEEVNGLVEQSFIIPTGHSGLPFAQIIDRSGRLAWMGHPSDGMDKALDEIVRGQFDLARFADEMNPQIKRRLATRPLYDEARSAFRTGEYGRANELIEKLLALDPDTYASLSVTGFLTRLISLDDPDSAYDYARRMMAGLWSEKPALLRQAASAIIHESGVPRRDFELALKLAKKAVELTQREDAQSLVALADALAALGDSNAAVEALGEALEKTSDADEAAIIKDKITQLSK